MEKGLKSLVALGRNASKKGPTPSSFEPEDSTASPQKESPPVEGDSGVVMDGELPYLDHSQLTDERVQTEQPDLRGRSGRKTSFDLPSIASIIHHPPH